MKVLLPISQTFEVRILKLEKYRELIELVMLSSLSFCIPLFIGHPQIVVGIIVNALIVRTALNMKNWKSLPTILLPSLGALTRGILFGPFTVYLLYLIPFIWFGNFVLTFFVKLLSRKHLLLSIILSSVLKAVAIFLPALVLVKLSIIPEAFLKSMGIVQLVTALVGGTVAIGILMLELRFGSNVPARRQAGKFEPA